MDTNFVVHSLLRQLCAREHKIFDMRLQCQGMNISLNALRKTKPYLHDPELKYCPSVFCLNTFSLSVK